MTRVLFFFTVCIALSGVGAAARGPAVESGAVYLTSLPSACDVWVDGTYVGRTPVLIDGLVSGTHSVTLARAGWAVQTLQIAVGADTVLRTVALRRSAKDPHGTGRIVFHGLPQSRAMLDGKMIDTQSSSMLEVASGPHVITARISNQRVTRTVMVYPEMTTSVLLQSRAASDTRSAVIAPAERYLPAAAFHVRHNTLSVNYRGHSAIGHLQSPVFKVDNALVTYDAAAELIHGKLYLPLELLLKLTAPKRK